MPKIHAKNHGNGNAVKNNSSGSDVELVLDYAVRGFMDKVNETMTYHSPLAKLHLYEIIMTNKKPDSAVYLTLQQAIRERNTALLSDIETVSLFEQYRHGFQDFRTTLEKSLFKDLATNGNKLLYWNHFLKLASKAHQGVPPDPQRVGDIKKKIDACHVSALRKLLHTFKLFSSKFQKRLLLALSHNDATGIKLGEASNDWFKNASLHLQQLFSNDKRQYHIDELIKIRKRSEKKEMLTRYNQLNLQFKTDKADASKLPSEPKTTKPVNRKLFT